MSMKLMFSHNNLSFIQRGNSIFGYVYDEELLNTSEYPDGSKRPYFTISYANGPGYHNHYVANGNGGAPPWKDPRDLDFEDADFTHPSMMPGPDVSESHGGEDVAVYATGTVYENLQIFKRSQ